MDSVTKLLVLCTFLSVIKLYESAATVTFNINPVRPVLTTDMTFTCEANYKTNKLKKLSVLAGNVEILSYQPDKRPRVQWKDDETKARFDFKKELSKTRTFLEMTLKKPKCTDQNIYKCIYDDGQAPIEEKIRLNFYVDKGIVEMIDNRESECDSLNITCIGQAGNPPEMMKWLKKKKGDSTYEPIDPTYISSDTMKFHQTNCSNTRKEHFIYKPSVDETDLLIKCGFGDEMEHMSFHSPVSSYEDLEIKVKPEGQHKVGEEIEVTCSGFGFSDMTKFKWFKKTKDSSDKMKIMTRDSKPMFKNTDSMCRIQASEMITYIPEINDEIIYCEAKDSGYMAKAEWTIQLGVISNPTDGITTKDSDEDEDDMEEVEEHEDMTTSEPSPEEETEDGSKAEPEAEAESETTTMDKSLSKPVQQDSGQLRSCLTSSVLIFSLVIIAILFLIEETS